MSRSTTRPPNNYAREQEIDNKQTKARSQQRQRIQDKPGTQCDAAISDESATESDDPSAANKLRQEIRRPDDLQRKELRNVGKEFHKVKENLVPPSQNST
jgi:hypothetical protein